MTGVEKLSLFYGPLGTAVEFKRKKEGGMRQKVGGGAQRFADLQITNGKKQIGLICRHACTCAQGKRHPELWCRRLSQSIQLLS